MLNYFLKRLFQASLVMLIVAFVSFSLFNFVGDPVNNMVGQEASDERREEIRDKLGINDPIYVQFYNFVENIVQGNFGISYQLKRPVSDLISERMPATLELVFVSALLAAGANCPIYLALSVAGLDWCLVNRGCALFYCKRWVKPVFGHFSTCRFLRLLALGTGSPSFAPWPDDFGDCTRILSNFGSW